MLKRFKECSITKLNLFKGCLRLSILTSLIAFLWCFFIETPKHTSIAFGISDQDARDLRKAADILVDGRHRYSYKEGNEYPNGIKRENKYNIKELDEWISDEDKNEIIKKFSNYWHPYGLDYKNIYICRASYSCDDIIDKALKRIIQNKTSMDYSEGYLVSNQKYGITQSSSTFISRDYDDEHRIFVHYSPNGYSIIPSLEEKLKWCSKAAGFWALLVFLCTSILLPLTCYSLYYSILIPLTLLAKLLDYFIWVRKGFL